VKEIALNELNLAETIEQRFCAWALAEENLRAAFIVGSRARRDHPADAWSDLDLILFFRDGQLDQYIHDVKWQERLAPFWLSTLGRTVAGEPERLVLYAGGLQVDFVFHPASDLAGARTMVESGNLPDTLHRGTRILVDKDGMIPALPAPSRPPAGTPPSAEEFQQVIESFWFDAVYCAKQLRRGELWMFQNGSHGMQWHLLRMLEFQARAVNGWEHDTWHAGKFISEWADPQAYAGLREVFSHFDAGDGWHALRSRLIMFHALAQETAGRMGFVYPDELVKSISACIDQIQAA
jgi:aminoglycoside 6-adenylyltransferase